MGLKLEPDLHDIQWRNAESGHEPRDGSGHDYLLSCALDASLIRTETRRGLGGLQRLPRP